jgi:hypothetical protein
MIIQESRFLATESSFLHNINLQLSDFIESAKSVSAIQKAKLVLFHFSLLIEKKRTCKIAIAGIMSRCGFLWL